ncbi:hypothetical protein EVAR_86940_1 [Eumeta japonica]|uniref:Uncharacterized protein n=1 Tax=Eumeta variegata TaxID=151549 RepID=A0A4C1W5S3_EUMVA|nr:hypothetical protein EVAR_86940_1 [Eumeta japonica]
MLNNLKKGASNLVWDIVTGYDTWMLRPQNKAAIDRMYGSIKMSRNQPNWHASEVLQVDDCFFLIKQHVATVALKNCTPSVPWTPKTTAHKWPRERLRRNALAMYLCGSLRVTYSEINLLRLSCSLSECNDVDLCDLLDALHILNGNRTPTFEMYRRNRFFKSVVDVTACSSRLLNRAEGWQVSLGGVDRRDNLLLSRKQEHVLFWVRAHTGIEQEARHSHQKDDSAL